MINDIIGAIGIALNEEFGDKYKVYAENQKQGFKAPCFFVQCINPKHDLFFGLKDKKQRYFREDQMCIQYFPEDLQNARTEINSVAERLDWCLEWITVTGDLVMGTNMHYEINDDVLSFFVNYDLFIHTIPDEENMEEYTLNQKVD